VPAPFSLQKFLDENVLNVTEEDARKQLAAEVGTYSILLKNLISQYVIVPLNAFDFNLSRPTLHNMERHYNATVNN